MPVHFLRISSFLALVILSSHLWADSFPEPFGLKWGMSVSDLEQLGFSQVEESGGLKVLTSVSVPKAWSKGDIYLAVTYEDRLVKVIANSKKFTDDILGAEGKRTYKQMKELLTEKYGAPASTFERIGGKLYDEPDEFYQCLDYSGCGGYMAVFEIQGGVIAVQLQGERRGVGHLEVIYETPEFAAAKAHIEEGDIESDADAF